MATVQVVKNTYTVDSLYQWDINQVLEIYGLSLPSVPELRFAHKGAERSIVRQARMDAAGVVRADVPNSLLQQPYTICVYVGLYEGAAFRTHYKIEVPVKPQAKPDEYTLTDDPEVYSFEQLENQVATAVSAMQAQQVKAAEAEVAMKSAQQDLSNATTRMDALTEKINTIELLDVDNLAATELYTVAVPVSWTVDATNGGHYQTVAVEGILEADTPIVDILLGANVTTNASLLAAWALVTRITTADGSITIWANGDAPTVEMTLQMKVVRSNG